MKRVYLVRHGETEGNLQRQYQSPDIVLTEKGHAGAKALAKRLSGLDIEVLIASPFKRAQQTVEHVQAALDIPVVTAGCFHEVLNASSMWGTSLDTEQAHTYEGKLKEVFADPNARLEDAESYIDVSARIEECIKMLEESPHTNIAVISHGNFLRFLIARLLLSKNPSAEHNIAVKENLFRMSNVGITEFIYEHNQWRLFTWNDHTHFAE